MGGSLYTKDVTELVVLASTATELDAPSTLTSVMRWAAVGNKNLSKLTLPAGTAKIGDAAFGLCENLSEITVYAVNPPVITESQNPAFSNYETAKLYVPKGSVEAYRKAYDWKNFKNILEIGATGIDQLATGGEPERYFDLMGRPVAHPESGVYVKVADGRAVKVKM